MAGLWDKICSGFMAPSHSMSLPTTQPGEWNFRFDFADSLFYRVTLRFQVVSLLGCSEALPFSLCASPIESMYFHSAEPTWIIALLSGGIVIALSPILMVAISDVLFSTFSAVASCFSEENVTSVGDVTRSSGDPSPNVNVVDVPLQMNNDPLAVIVTSSIDA